MQWFRRLVDFRQPGSSGVLENPKTTFEKSFLKINAFKVCSVADFSISSLVGLSNNRQYPNLTLNPWHCSSSSSIISCIRELLSLQNVLFGSSSRLSLKTLSLSFGSFPLPSHFFFSISTNAANRSSNSASSTLSMISPNLSPPMVPAISCTESPHLWSVTRFCG